MDDQYRKMMGEVAAWAKQTLSFAISVRALESDKTLDDENAVRLAASEAHDLTNELFEETQKECGPNPPIGLLITKYARKVFDWSDKHINPSP